MIHVANLKLNGQQTSKLIFWTFCSFVFFRLERSCATSSCPSAFATRVQRALSPTGRKSYVALLIFGRRLISRGYFFIVISCFENVKLKKLDDLEFLLASTNHDIISYKTIIIYCIQLFRAFQNNVRCSFFRGAPNAQSFRGPDPVADEKQEPMKIPVRDAKSEFDTLSLGSEKLEPEDVFTCFYY